MRRPSGGMVRLNVLARIGKKTTTRCHKTTPKAQTRTDFEEDCDAVNQARASKINESGYSAYQRVFGRNLPQTEDAIMECGGADQGVVGKQQAGDLTQERSMIMRRLALQASLALDHKRRWKRNEPCTMQQNITSVNYMLDNPFGSGDVERMQPRNQQMLFGTRVLSSATRWPQFGLPTANPLASVHDPRCDRFTRTMRRPTNASRNTCR